MLIYAVLVNVVSWQNKFINKQGGTNTLWIDTTAWWRSAVRGQNITINVYLIIIRQTINETLYTHYLQWTISFITKSLFSYVNKGPIWYGFCAGTIAICLSVNMAYIWGPRWHLLVAPSSVNHCLIFFFSLFNSAMKVDPLQEIEWLPEKSWDRNSIFFTMARKVNLLKLLLRKRKRKQIMQEKGDYVRKLLLLACKMWKMDQQIHVMFKNKSKEIIAFVNDHWTFSITTASLPSWISQGVTDAN